jgi:hypothetical protein
VPLPRLYTDLAGWFHLLTAPEEYDEEATAYRDATWPRRERARGRCWSSARAVATTPGT